MDLSRLSGLTMDLDRQGVLRLGEQVQVQEYRRRALSELAAVALDPAGCQGGGTAYEMFNGVFDAADQARLEGLAVRYELTLFPDLRIGREYNKTLGHIHQPEPRSGIDYPEICEVLAGRAHFFFMRLDPSGQRTLEAFYVELSQGETLLIPPGYDHLTINPGPGPLLFSDVVALGMRGDYSRISAMGGAAYLEVEQDGQSVFIPNPRQLTPPPLRRLRPLTGGIPGLAGRPLYRALLETRAHGWEFLWQPERFARTWPVLDELFALVD